MNKLISLIEEEPKYYFKIIYLIYPFYRTEDNIAINANETSE